MAKIEIQKKRLNKDTVAAIVATSMIAVGVIGLGTCLYLAGKNRGMIMGTRSALNDFLDFAAAACKANGPITIPSIDGTATLQIGLL